MKLAVDSLIIVLLVFSGAILTGVLVITNMNTAYPEANISSEWGASFNQMENLTTISESVENQMTTASESGGLTLFSTIDLLWTGTVQAISNAFSAFALVPPMVEDIQKQEEFNFPNYIGSIVIGVLTVAIVFTILYAFWYRRS